MGLSRMVDHIKPLLRPKSDQQFSHSLGTKRTSAKVRYEREADIDRAKDLFMMH